MIPRLKAALGLKEIISALHWPGSNDVKDFELAFARIAEQKYAVAFPYGRTGLIAVLKALGLRDAEVICPSYTCVVVPHAIVTSGNVPVFVDSKQDDFNMDLELLDSAVSSNTKAIIATSIFGQPVNLDLLDSIRKRYPHIPIIQDCAHSFFCEWQGRPVHKEGVCAIYGLNVSKIMTSVFGGMVTTNDADFAGQLIDIRNDMLSSANRLKSIRRLLYLFSIYPAFSRIGYGLVNKLERTGLLDKFVKYYDPAVIDMPDDYLEAMSSLEARVGLAQLKKYPSIVKHRQKIAKLYLDELENIQGLTSPKWNEGATWSHFVIRSEKANIIYQYCLDHGVQLGRLIDYYIPDMPSYIECNNLSTNVAKKLPDLVLNLPVHMGISEKDARYIVNLIKNSLFS